MSQPLELLFALALIGYPKTGLNLILSVLDEITFVCYGNGQDVSYKYLDEILSYVFHAFHNDLNGLGSSIHN